MYLPNLLLFFWSEILGILFVACTILMLVIGKIAPRDKDFELEENAKVDMSPWKLLYPVGIAASVAMIVIYILLSPIGIIS